MTNPTRKILAAALRNTGAVAAVALIAACGFSGGYDDAAPIYDQEYGDPSAGRPGLILPELDRDAFPGCLPMSKFEEGDIVPTVVVVNSQADMFTLGTDAAFAANGNAEKADDLYVIGFCR